ncbi:hypothetical protein CSOJ01_04405 [Colletotrichum sojae]|uniref:Uncharacterized protein n=1 Tax=Colletotrichum sojae TaxID=2175907 RepID=A0A8H6JJP3_9PEZI|nr:hypothetical protein CSOJ01_04405 [Colletotrichum sojae]
MTVPSIHGVAASERDEQVPDSGNSTPCPLWKTSRPDHLKPDASLSLYSKASRSSSGCCAAAAFRGTTGTSIAAWAPTAWHCWTQGCRRQATRKKKTLDDDRVIDALSAACRFPPSLRHPLPFALPPSPLRPATRKQPAADLQDNVGGRQLTAQPTGDRERYCIAWRQQEQARASPAKPYLAYITDRSCVHPDIPPDDMENRIRLEAQFRQRQRQFNLDDAKATRPPSTPYSVPQPDMSTLLDYVGPRCAKGGTEA